MRWRCAPPVVALALDREFERWSGTPFMEGAQAPGMGVDCIRFVGAVWDKCRGKSLYTPIKVHRTGPGNQHPKAFGETLYALLEAYGPLVTARDGILEPGDMIVTKAGPHCWIVGTRRGTAWTASRRGVLCQAIGALGAATVLRTFRPTDKQGWQ